MNYKPDIKNGAYNNLKFYEKEYYEMKDFFIVNRKVLKVNEKRLNKFYNTKKIELESDFSE